MLKGLVLQKKILVILEQVFVVIVSLDRWKVVIILTSLRKDSV